MKPVWQKSMTALALASAGAVAACTTAPGSSPNSTSTPSATPTMTCPAGTWRSTGVTSSASVGGTPVTFDGGKDVTVSIGSDGAVTADFSKMQPIAFTASVAGTQVKGEIVYNGPIQGKVDLSARPSTSGTTTSGTSSSSASSTTTSSAAPATGAGSAWTPVGTVNRDNLRITVRVLQPVAATVVDNLKITDVPGTAAAQTGNSVDLQPLLHDGQYSCDGNDRLTITTSAGVANGPSVVWMLAHA
jgi:hypothetical protein